jgi:hypothetical protein
MEMTAFAAIHVQKVAVHLDGAAPGPESPDLGLGLIVSEEAGFAAPAAAVVF